MKQNPISPEQIIQEAETKWQDAQGMSQETILKLAILRETIRNLHSEKSWCLASGYPEEAEQYHSYESLIDKLVNETSLKEPLREILDRASKLPDHAEGVTVSTRKIPTELLELLPTEKIERYDRYWEKALVCEAAKIKWEFWKLKAHVQVELASNCEQALAQEIGNQGIILFAESSENFELREGIWQGQWLMIIEPGYDCRSIPLASIPGLSLIPNPPQWTLLHR